MSKRKESIAMRGFGLSEANIILKRMVRSLYEGTKRVDGGKWELDGKVGVWRDVGLNNPVFFPDDGSKPRGMPGELQKKMMKGGGHGGDGTKEVQRSVKRARKKLTKASAKAAKKATGALGGDDKEVADKIESGQKVSKKQAKKAVASGVQKAIMLGLGVALLAAFPAALGYAAMYLVGQMAVDKTLGFLGRNLGFSEAKGSSGLFSKSLQQGLEAAIADLAQGNIDEKQYAKALKFAEKKTARKDKKKTSE
jgi:hypothetical protein